jgi:hypothetical protein
MIYHIVVMKFKEGADANKIMEDIRHLKNTISQIVSFTDGINCSKEGLSKGFTHGFTVQFQSVADRDAYLVHPDHVHVANDIIIPNLLGGKEEGVLVFDYEV